MYAEKFFEINKKFGKIITQVLCHIGNFDIIIIIVIVGFSSKYLKFFL